MAETLSIHLPDFSGTITLNLFLRRTDTGALLNTGGDALTESPASSGRFTSTLTEARVGLGTLASSVCDGTESADNLVWDGWLPEGDSISTDTYPQPVAIDAADIRDAIGMAAADLDDQLDDILAASGGLVTVNVLPATGIVADRSAGVTLNPVVGETISQAITLYETDGTTPVDLSGQTLVIVFETMSRVDVATVDNADITVSGVDNNVVTFAYPSAVTATERVLRFALRDDAAPLTMYLQGICSVVSAPQVDPP